MSDDEEKVDGEINPDLLEAGFDDDTSLGEDESLEDGDLSLEKAAEDEDEEGALADKFDDEYLV